MRVIAGRVRRVALVAPAGMRTRPTADRAKEALFSIIAGEIVGARFLDLFCGSGAVGIEALSRGAASAVFVEHEKNALAALEKNLAAVKKADTLLAAQAEVCALSVSRALDELYRAGRKFDIIFLDPPYESGQIDAVLAQLEKYNVRAHDCTIIAETDMKLELPDARGYTLLQRRDYGRTRFLFYTGAAQGECE